MTGALPSPDAQALCLGTSLSPRRGARRPTHTPKKKMLKQTKQKQNSARTCLVLFGLLSLVHFFIKSAHSYSVLDKSFKPWEMVTSISSELTLLGGSRWCHLWSNWLLPPMQATGMVFPIPPPAWPSPACCRHTRNKPVGERLSPAPASLASRWKQNIFLRKKKVEK